MDQAALEARLSEYDFVALIDASGSMGERDLPGGKSRWQHMQESVTAFCRDLEALDSDGIDIVLFGGSTQAFQSVTADKVKDIFASRAPRGSTPLDAALEQGLKLAGKSSKKDFIIVFTDGVPDDQQRVADIIRNQANRQQTDDELTILFVQVGYDSNATAYLRNLDDNLRGAKFDIVDAKTIEEAEKFSSTAELILAAIND